MLLCKTKYANFSINLTTWLLCKETNESVSYFASMQGIVQDKM